MIDNKMHAQALIDMVKITSVEELSHYLSKFKLQDKDLKEDTLKTMLEDKFDLEEQADGQYATTIDMNGHSITNEEGYKAGDIVDLAFLKSMVNIELLNGELTRKED